jgi:hypothetical protein
MPELSQMVDTSDPGGRGPWSASAYPHGRGRLDPANLVWEGNGGRILLPAGRHDGAEAASPWHFHGGTFSARIRAAHAPGSIVALGLSECVPGKENEVVTLEIENDGSGRVCLRTVCGDRQAMTERELGWDPAAELHDYCIRWRPGEEVVWLADDREIGRQTQVVPSRPLCLVIGAWWPERAGDLPSSHAAQVEVADAVFTPRA